MLSSIKVRQNLSILTIIFYCSFIVLALIIASVVISSVLTIRNQQKNNEGSAEGAELTNTTYF